MRKIKEYKDEEDDETCKDDHDGRTLRSITNNMVAGSPRVRWNKKTKSWENV